MAAQVMVNAICLTYNPIWKEKMHSIQEKKCSALNEGLNAKL